MKKRDSIMEFKDLRKILNPKLRFILKVLIVIILIVISLYLYSVIQFSEVLKIFRVQDFLIKTLDIDAEKAAPMVITILIFFGGIASSIIISLSKGAITRYQNRKVFINICKRISKSSMVKAYRFYNCAIRFDVKIKENFGMNSGAVDYLDLFQKIDYNKFYEAFFSGPENLFKSSNAINAFNSIYSAISNIQVVESRYENQFGDFLQKYNEIEKRRNEAIMGVKKNLDEMFDKVNWKNVPNEVPVEYFNYLQGINGIMMEWQGKENSTLPSVFDEFFIQKIRLYNSENNKNKSIAENIPNDLYYTLNDSDNEYKSLEIIVNNYNRIFMSYFKSYKKYSRKIYNSIHDLSIFKFQ